MQKKDITLPKNAQIVDSPDIGTVVNRMNALKNIPGYQGNTEDNEEFEKDADSRPTELNPGEIPDMDKAMEDMKKLFGN